MFTYDIATSASAILTDPVTVPCLPRSVLTMHRCLSQAMATMAKEDIKTEAD